MSRSIQPLELHRSLADHVLVDVRREPARLASGRTIPGSVYKSPSAVAEWGHEFKSGRVVVFCVHGHEVSQNSCDWLCDHGIDAVYLEGGIEGWIAAGFATQAIEVIPS